MSATSLTLPPCPSPPYHDKFRNEMTPQARAALNLDLRDMMFMQNAAEPVRVSTVSGCSPSDARLPDPRLPARRCMI